jgi:hypothetical protein
LAVALVGCGGDGADPVPVAPTEVTGRVVAAPVGGATVQLLPLLNTGALGAPVAETTTDADGFYLLSFGDFAGPAVVMAKGGSYVDEATGNDVDQPELTLASLVVVEQAKTQSAHVTLPTTLAAHRAQVLAAQSDTDALAALHNAVAMVEDYFGVAGLLATEPALLTEGKVAAGAAAEHGALNAACAQLAADQQLRLDSLLLGLAKDGSDGAFDGQFYGSTLTVEGATQAEKLSTKACGSELIAAIASFLDNPRNQSDLGIDDLVVDEAIRDNIVDENNGLEHSRMVGHPTVTSMDTTLAPVGESKEVTFRGYGLAGLDVLFGGATATVLADDDAILRVEAPASDTPGKVDVVLRGREVAVQRVYRDAFEYFVPNQSPSIHDISPDHGPAIGGALVEVRGADFDPTAIVEFGGLQAQTVARIGRELIIAAAPPGVSDVSVTVRQADSESAPSVTRLDAFSYRDRDVGPGSRTGDLEGTYGVYGLGVFGPDMFSGMILKGTFDGNGSFNQSGQFITAHPGQPDTVGVPDLTMPYRVFADGTLWNGDAEQAWRGWLTDDLDVFVYTQDSGDGIQAGVAIRQAEGMSVAALTGTWHIATIGHIFDPNGSGRRAGLSGVGTVEFDGAGRGSAGLVEARRIGGQDPGEQRLPGGGGFGYTVNADGTFTVTTDGDEPFVIEGSVTQRGDLAVGLGTGGGQITLVILVPAGTGFTNDHGHGSWYGGVFNYDFENNEHVYSSGVARLLADANGEQLVDVTTYQYFDDEYQLGQEPFLATNTVSPTGLLHDEGVADVAGFLSPSRRFFVVAEAMFGNSPGVSPIRNLMGGLLVRKAAFYSKWSMDRQIYNALGIGTRYPDADDPLSYAYKRFGFLSQVAFDAAPLEGMPHEGIGSVEEWEEGQVLGMFNRDGEGNTSQSQLLLDASEGGFAVMGDGRLFLFIWEDLLIGELTPHGSLAVLRTFAATGLEDDDQPAPSTLAFLVKATESQPTLTGDYEFGEWFMAESAIAMGSGGMTLTAETGGGYSFDAVNTYFMSSEDGTTSSMGPIAASGSVSGTMGWFTFDTESGTVPIDFIAAATPDGSAFVSLAGAPDESFALVPYLRVAVRVKGPVQSAGVYKLASLYHEYTPPASEGPSVERYEIGEGVWEIPLRLEAGIGAHARFNNRPELEAVRSLFPDQSLAVGQDASLAWQVLGTTYRGWLSDNTRYAFLLPATSQGVPTDTELMIIFRR